MSAIHLSILAMRGLLSGACRLVGSEVGQAAVESVTNFLSRRLNDSSQKPVLALKRSIMRTWRAIEIALAGESLTSRLDRAEDRTFREQVRLFVAASSSELASLGVDFRRRALADLKAARKQGVLLGGEPNELAAGHAAKFAGYTNPTQAMKAEWHFVKDLGESLRKKGYEDLGKLTELPGQGGVSLVAIAVRFFFCQEVTDDPELFQKVIYERIDSISDQLEKGFHQLSILLQEQGDRLELLLESVQTVVVQTHGAVLDLQAELLRQGEESRDQFAALFQSIQMLQTRLAMVDRPLLRPRDSMSIRDDAERQSVHELVAQYRRLPVHQRQMLPALLNAIGKLEVAAGDFENAGKDFDMVTRMVQDNVAKGEAHHNAYRVALERTDWHKAFYHFVHWVNSDPIRLAPFPTGRYAPKKIIGAGGFGVVFLCQDKKMEVEVVVKILLPDELDRRTDDVLAEARALDQLDHPAVIRMRDYGYTNSTERSRPYLVMPYFEGQTLESLARSQQLTAVDVRQIAVQIAGGLKAAHEKNILHRDVKPANVLVSRTETGWNVKLIDFGLAVRLNPADIEAAAKQNTITGISIAGSVDYAAPEQLGRLPGTQVTHASDVYGFGKTCCYALFQTAQPTRKHWNSLPHDLCDLLEKCVEETPSARPANFTEVLELLEPPAQSAAKATRKSTKDKLTLELVSEDAAIFDDFCAADALKKHVEKFHKEKKDLVEGVFKSRAIEHWFRERSRPDNPVLQTGTSKANLIIPEGKQITIPPLADGSSTTAKVWLTAQGLDQDLAEQIAANETIRQESKTYRLGLPELLAGSPERQVLGQKLVRMVFERLISFIEDIQFTDGGEQFNALLDETLSPEERMLLDETVPTTTTTLPDDLLERAVTYCQTREQFEQLFNVINPRIYLSHMKYHGQFDRVLEGLTSAK